MFNLVVAGLVLPLVTSLILLLRPRRPAGGWIATFVLATGMAAFSVFTVPWGLLIFWLRYVVAALYLVALGVSLSRQPDDRPDDSPTRMLVKILIGLFFGSVALGVFRAHAVPPNARDVSFPLAKGGKYAVVHGGSTTAANTYFGRGAEAFAVDLVRVDGRMGDALIVNPCPEGAAGGGGAPLKVTCGDVVVTMVRTGPVLHVHGERNGQAAPLTFGGRWLVRNDVVRP